jgi:5-methylcytosine-specific restriction endonuclease McrA
MQIGNHMKHCPKCQESKLLTDFYRNSANANGLDSMCKPCRRTYVKARYPANRDRVIANVKAWQNANREHVRARRAEYRAAHRAEMTEYRQTNRETIAANAEAWRKANAGRVRSHSATRKARKNQQGAFTVAAKDLRRLLASPCAVHGCQNREIQIDHIIPLARGGSHGIGNLQPLCAHHNQSKHTKLWIEFRAYLALKERLAA